jgi:integrase
MAPKRTPSKAEKGTVSAKNSNGRLQLVFRHPQTRKQVYLSTGLRYDKVNITGQLNTIGAEIGKAIAFRTIDEWLEQRKASQESQSSQDTLTLKLALADLWQRYTDHKKEVGHRGRPIAESTIQRDYGKIQKRLEALPLDLNVPEKAQEIKEWLKVKGKFSNETLRRTLMQLNACCEWATKSGFLEVNPFASVDRPAIQRNGNSGDYRAFSDEELRAIVAAFENDTYSSPYSRYRHSHYAPYVKLMFMLGCRPEELVALQWGDIGQDFSTLKIERARPCDTRIEGMTKTGAVRTIQCNAQLRDYLTSLKPEGASKTDLVVTSPTGKYLDYHNFANRVWEPVIRKMVEAGKVREYLPQYNMRHTAITRALAANVAVADVARMVGNSPETIWKHYASTQSEARLPEI